MGLHISIPYKDNKLSYDVTIQEEGVYHLKLDAEQSAIKDEYVPEKIIVRRKGKIWISDLEDHSELVEALTKEILNFNSEDKLSA